MFDSELLKHDRNAGLVRPARRRPSSPPEQVREPYPVIRALDVTIAVLALLFLGPLMLVVAALIKLQDRGPVLFSQRRIGLGGEYFACFKFRSMVVDAEERLARVLAFDAVARAEWDADHKLRNDPRITALGRFLRKSSLDELPQLFNVLSGEMSLVGPRPIVSGEIVRYGRAFRHYCSVKPGITGLWQISGRNEVSYGRRVALDIAFARSKCVGLYLKVLVGTLPSVLMRKGAY